MSDNKFDDKPYKITILLIVSFATAFTLVMIFNETLLKDVAAIWGAWIGAAIGYFFGSRPTETILHSLIDLVNQRKKELDEEKMKSVKDNADMMGTFLDYEHKLDQSKSEIQVVNNRYQKAKEEIINIITNYGNKIDDINLITRLKYEYMNNKV